MPHPWLERSFPGLRGTDYDVTSPATPDYNCIAWAAADSQQWWEPDPFHQYFWPANAPRSQRAESYLAAFATLGYEVCASSEVEAGFEKIALYANRDGIPTHMARQLHDGTWTSKLGPSVDIRHPSLESLEGAQYGRLLTVLRRRRANLRPLPAERTE